MNNCNILGQKQHHFYNFMKQIFKGCNEESVAVSMTLHVFKNKTRFLYKRSFRNSSEELAQLR